MPAPERVEKMPLDTLQEAGDSLKAKVSNSLCR